MKIGVMQPYFLPYLGYWQLIDAVDEYVVYDDVNYIKRGWINRNYILLNGKKYMIHLKVKNASQNRLIKDTQLVQSKKDTKTLLLTLEHAYHKAPYYDQVFPILERILTFDSDMLSVVLVNQIDEICQYLGIRTKIILSSEIEKDNGKKGEEKIIEICKRRNANYYINAIGGQALYHKAEFEKNEIELRFLKMHQIIYKQFNDVYKESLSIVDVLMFNEIEKIKEYLKNYELI